MKKILSNFDCYKLIRKPTPKPSIRMKSKKDYKRSLWKRDSLYILSHFFLGNSIKELQKKWANNLITHS